MEGTGGPLNPQELHRLVGHSSDVTSCDFDHNMTLVTGSSDKSVRIWDWITTKGYSERAAVSPVYGHKYGITCVKISPQGSMIVSASIDGATILWNLSTMVKLATFVQVHGNSVRVVRFSRDSSLLITAGDNGAICIWDLVHHNLIRTMVVHEGAVNGLEFTIDCLYLVSACSQEVIRVWCLPDLLKPYTENSADVDTNLQNPLISVNNSHDLGILSLAVSPDIERSDTKPFFQIYTFAVGGNSEIIKIWSLVITANDAKSAQNKNAVTLKVCDKFEGHTSAVTCVMYSSDGALLVSASVDKCLKIWNTKGSCLATLAGHVRYVNCATFCRDSMLIASGSNDKIAIVWDLTGRLNINSQLIRISNVQINVCPSEEEIVAESQNNSNKVILLEKVDDISEGAINSCCFYKNIWLATGSADRTVRVFRIGNEINSLEELDGSPIENNDYPVKCVDFNRDGLLAACSLDGSSLIIDPVNMEGVLFRLPKRDGNMRVCKFSPKGDILAVAGDSGIVTTWNLNSNETVAVIRDSSESITSISYSPDNTFLTTCSDGDFRIWSLNEGNLLYTKEFVHDMGIQCSDMSENLNPLPRSGNEDIQNYLLATGGNDNLIKSWQIRFKRDETGNIVHDDPYVSIFRTFSGHGCGITSVKFCPATGEIIASTSGDRQARLWSIFGGSCLHVLNHDSMVNCVAFSTDMSLLATGTLNKALHLWKLPRELIFKSMAGTNIWKTAMINWNKGDIIKWLKYIEFDGILQKIDDVKMNGSLLYYLNETEMRIYLNLGILQGCCNVRLMQTVSLADENQSERLEREIRWYKMDERRSSITIQMSNIPNHYCCPITHEVMVEPVNASDGFTYERQAIMEWFLSGKCTSPMTNLELENTNLQMNNTLRNEIHNHIYEQ